MAEYQAGSTVSIAADIVVNGAVVFSGGEQVTIQKVAPNPQRPEYRYVVQSARTRSWFTLREADFAAGYAPTAPTAMPAVQPMQFAAPAQPQYQPPPPAPKASGALKGCLIAFAVVAGVGTILAVVLFVVIGVGIHHVVQQVEKTTKNGISLPGGVTLSSKVPTEAELGIPVYPGSKMAASSISIKNPSGDISATVLYTDDAPATVVAWYKDKLSSKPEYQVLSGTESDALITFKGSDGAVMMVTIGKDQSDNTGKTTIAVGSSQGGTVPGTQ